MATLETRITLLAQAIGSDIKTLTANQGSLTLLTTTDKSSLVAAINEVKASASGAVIDDASIATDKVWSSTKTNASITNAINALINGAGSALDTLKELADALGNDPNFATTIATALSNRVRYDDVQTLTAAQMLQACSNIGVGNYDRDFVADYIAAKT